MASATAVASSISSTAARRLHYQSQISNASVSLNQSFTGGEASNINDSFSTPTISVIPLVTIVYSNASLSQEKQNMETSRRNSSVTSIGGIRTADSRRQTVSGTCTFIRLVHGENQQLLLNSYASCRRLLDHMKQVVGIHHDETIDLMDNEGKIKELNMHFDDYATQFLTARSTYYVLKIDVDTTTGEKRYTPNFNIDQIDQKLSTILSNSLNTLNKSVKTPKRPTGTTRQNTTVQSSSNTPQSKAKRTSSRKQN